MAISRLHDYLEAGVLKVGIQKIEIPEKLTAGLCFQIQTAACILRKVMSTQ